MDALDPQDQARLKAATEKARQTLEDLELSDEEKRFAERQAEALVKAWLADPAAQKEMASRRLRPRAVPAAFAYALGGVEALYEYAMRRYPSRGA